MRIIGVSKGGYQTISTAGALYVEYKKSREQYTMSFTSYKGKMLKKRKLENRKRKGKRNKI